MSVSLMSTRRSVSLAAVLFMVVSIFAAIPAQAVPGVPPDITGINSVDTDIDPGETRNFVVDVVGYDVGGSWVFSGTGLTVTSIRPKANSVRLAITADATAEAGLRDLTAINPDGLSDTWPDAILVTGDTEPPDLGDLTGHVFDDLNGNGVEDGGEGGLSGVSVSVTDFDSVVHSVSTDGSGNFSLLALPVGDASATFTTPAGYALTTGNSSQTVTIVVDTSVATADVGYQSIPSGDLTGHVFSDLDGNGVEDGTEVGLADVSVSVTDFGGATYNAMTDASGDYSVAGLEPGDATVTYTTPANTTLTTGNGVQTVTIVDGSSVAAADVGYEPPAGVAPEINGVLGNSEIDPGETRNMRFTVVNYEAGATVTFSGTGVTGVVIGERSGTLRVSVTATESAAGGARDVTLTNPSGLSDTLVGGITVTGDVVPPENGDVTGHVFADLDGNGIEDGSDVGLAGVSVSFTDAASAVWNGVTDGSGNFTINAGVGAGTLTLTTPAGYSLTTGNDVQGLTVTDGGSTAAAAVGYEPGATAFVDVGGTAGIVQSHVTGAHCGPPIGVGSAWADVDNDGDLDLYTTDFDNQPNRMYLSNGDGTFTESAAALGIDQPAPKSFATVFADIDNDGDADLFVHDDDGGHLYENKMVDNGSLSFVDISGTSGLFDNGRVETATFGDLDEDGFVDLYLAKHMSCNGTPQDRLFHNNGDGTFTDWTTYLCDGGDPATCDDVNGLGFSAAMFDYDQDGDLDIYLVNDNISNVNQPNKMFRNDGSDGGSGWLFTETSAATGTDISLNGMGLGLGDYNNDGWIDIAFSDVGPPRLLMADGDGTYTNVSDSTGVTGEFTEFDISWGTAFIDYDNNGLEDLFYAQGYIGDELPMANKFLVNGGGTFSDAAALVGLDGTDRARNVSIADYNADGWVDMFIGNFNAAPNLMENQSASLGNTNGYLTVTVEGTESNRDAIGTEMVLTTSAGSARRVITSGQNHGGGSQKAAFFGLGGDSTGSLTVYWPNGQVQVISTVGADQAIHLVEPATPGPSDGTFTNVAGSVGITFTHSEGGECAPAIGVGAAWADVDNDGDQDLYATNRSGANHLYRNDGGSFTDVAGALGIAHSGLDSSATVFVDYDNDGDSDLFVAHESGNSLWENQLVPNGNVSFSDVTSAAGLANFGRVQTATWGDVDGDGFADVYLAKHMTCVGDGVDRLFHNNGDGTFSDWTTYLCGGGAVPCADVNGLGFAAGMFDYDNDGDQDIYLVNDNIAGNFQPNKLWRNDGAAGGGGWTFVEVGAAAGADLSVNGMGLGVGDYNNDGWFDIAFSDAGPGHLLMNNGDGTFADVSASSGVTAETAGAVGWGSAFFDYDNDGWQDLFYAHGSIAIEAPYANGLLENQGNGTFVNVSNDTNMGDTNRGRNVSLADYDGDGWVDVYVGNYDTAPLLMHNDSAAGGNTNNWLTVTVEGTDSNRDGLGTVISLTAGGQTQNQLISSGFSHGGGSQKAAFFGLGTAGSGTLTVTWPNGAVENLGSFTAGQALHLVEPAN